MYSKFEELLEAHNVTAYKVAKATGVARSTLSEWKNGRSVPKVDKLQKIADYFGVSLNYFYDVPDDSGYYLNEETARKAQEIYDDPNTRILLDARRDLSPEDLELVVAMIKKLRD